MKTNAVNVLVLAAITLGAVSLLLPTQPSQPSLKPQSATTPRCECSQYFKSGCTCQPACRCGMGSGIAASIAEGPISDLKDE